MKAYNYEEAVKNDVRTWIDDNVKFSDWDGNREGLEDKESGKYIYVDVTTRCGKYPVYLRSENLLIIERI